MEIIVYVIAIIFCFFILYVLARHDFVLLRQNISLSEIFDALFITLISAYLIGRSLFMVDRLSSDLLSFFRFFHIFKYPGISLFGAYIGGALALYLIFMKKKGMMRICDIFAISFFPLAAANLLFINHEPFGVVVSFVLFLISIIFFIFFLSSHNKYILRDGSVSLVFLILLALQTLFIEFINPERNKLLFLLSLMQILCLFIVGAGIILLFINQRKKHS